MSWREVLGEDPAGWERLDPGELGAWLDAELAGRGLVGARDDSEPADLVRDAAQRGGTDVRRRIEEALTAIFCRRFDRADEAGACAEPDRLPLSLAARALERLPVSPERAPLERLERGTYAEWARVRVTAHAAPHPLRQSFARAWLAATTLEGPALRRMLADPELVNLAVGTLYGDLHRAVQHLPAAVATLLTAGRKADVALHVRMLRDRHGGPLLAEAIAEQRMAPEVREALDAALRKAGAEPRRAKVTDLLDLERTRGLLGGENDTSRLPGKIA